MRIIIANTKEALLLFVGDIVFFAAALWLTLFVRRGEFPSGDLFYTHLEPFSMLFAAWFVVFFIAGLYDKHTMLFKQKLPATIFKAQVANIILAALFFFFIPLFGIAPKTVLVIYLFVSFILIVLWRLTLFPLLMRHIQGNRRPKAILVGTGREAQELFDEINSNNRYPFKFVLSIDPNTASDPLSLEAELLERVSSGEVSVIVGDSTSPVFKTLVPVLSNLAFLKINFRFIDIVALYENIFERVPLSIISHGWFLESISTSPRRVYDLIKRLMDIVGSLVLGAAMLLLFPFIYIAIKLEDKGSIFYVTERVGKDNAPVSIFKFRSMTGMDKGDDVIKSKHTVTRVGKFLRRTRLDEFPQLINVIKGEVSLIGPRLELPALVKRYAERIPHYNMRHIITPGLTGWAQINHHEHPHHGIDFEETNRKLSYDLYYVKNRSFLLDVQIALKTIKVFVSLAGK